MPVTSIAFSPNGRQLATGSGDKAARVWDLSTGMLSALLEVCSMGRGLHPPSPPSALIAGVHRRCLSNFREGGDPCAVHLTTNLEATLLAADRTEDWYNGALYFEVQAPPCFFSSLRATPTSSTASPSVPMGGSWPLAAWTGRRGYGTCPPPNVQHCLRSV